MTTQPQPGSEHPATPALTGGDKELAHSLHLIAESLFDEGREKSADLVWAGQSRITALSAQVAELREQRDGLHDLHNRNAKYSAELLAECQSKGTRIAELERDKARLDWLERFLQLGNSSVYTSPTCQPHEARHDDTDETQWNHPFHIGYEVEVEHRGCYRWEEKSNGSRAIRAAIDAAMNPKQP